MSRPYSAFLYCIQIADGGVAKVGVSSSPKARIGALSATAPFDLKFRRVIGFQSRRIADAWERHIIINANRYRERGEWVLCDDDLDRLFGEVTEGEDCTDRMGSIMSSGRVVPDGANISDVHKVIVRERLSGVDLDGIEYSGDPDDFMPSIVRGRLRQGYGVEDIAIMDGFSPENIREAVSEIRKRQAMTLVLFGPDKATKAAGSIA